MNQSVSTDLYCARVLFLRDPASIMMSYQTSGKCLVLELLYDSNFLLHCSLEHFISV